ncbi:Gifsy-2 prophage protein [Enterobacter cloacae]|nr:Gifsy-2 prophage protein [Enterobacter cloacae]
MSPEAAREWMRQHVGGKEAEEIASDGAVPTDKFVWHAVTRTVGNVKNQGRNLILFRWDNKTLPSIEVKTFDNSCHFTRQIISLL